MDAAIAIPNLLYRYADHIDGGRLEDAAAMFDHGALIVGGQDIRGREASVAMWRSWLKLYEDGTPKTRHIMTNPIIELSQDGASATCQSQWTVIQATPDLPLQVIASGRYHDRLARVDGQWVFLERRYGQVDVTGNMGAHILQNLTNRNG